MRDKDTFIDGGLLREQREIRGWTINDIAMRACLSAKQIQQLEEGGSESFYSSAVKLTAAKKVAALLGVSMTQGAEQSEISSLTDGLHSSPAVVQEPSLSKAITQIESVPAEFKQEASNQAAKTPQLSLWVLGVLFASALLIAAWLNPTAEPVANEAVPPLQILSSEMSETTSSAASVVQDGAISASAGSQMLPLKSDEPASSTASSDAVRALNAAEAASR